jgi:hypothetical protein
MGNGHALALQLCPTPPLPPVVQAFQPNAEIGMIPPQFNPSVDGYQHIDIYKLIIFYNDSFGIVLGDPLHERKRKIRTWLMEYLV